MKPMTLKIFYYLFPISHDKCPIGADENSNPVIKEWGNKIHHSEDKENHVQIAERLGLIDLMLPQKLQEVVLHYFEEKEQNQRSLIQFLLDKQTNERGYTEISPPYVVDRNCMIGTGQCLNLRKTCMVLRKTKCFLLQQQRCLLLISREKRFFRGGTPIKYTAHTLL